MDSPSFAWSVERVIKKKNKKQKQLLPKIPREIWGQIASGFSRFRAAAAFFPRFFFLVSYSMKQAKEGLHVV